MPTPDTRTDFEKLFGFTPRGEAESSIGKVHRGLEQTTVCNEIEDLQHQMRRLRRLFGGPDHRDAVNRYRFLSEMIAKRQRAAAAAGFCVRVRRS